MKKVLSNKEEKELIEQLESRFGLVYTKKDKFEITDNFLRINSVPKFFYFENRPVPTLKLLLETNCLKKITVDMGAVRFVVSGADIMRPGITNIDDGIQKGEFVTIIDMTHSKPLAVGLALFSGEDITSMATGKVIKNLHYVGDKLWSYN